MAVKDLVVMKPPVPTLRGRTVLITGAASGIGRSTALAAARDGARLVLTDLRTADLDTVVAEIEGAGGTVALSRAGDVSDYEWVKSFGAEVDEQVGTMDVVMNVAGISAWGTVENLEHRHWRAMVDVNLMGPIHIIECFVPQMVRRGEGGHLVNVSSAAGLLALPWHAAYSASKFGIRGVSEVLRMDLRQHNIGVSVVCPGGVATPLVGTVDIVGVDKDDPKVRKQIDNFHKIAVTPEKAAAAIIAGVEKNKFVVYTSFDTRFGYWWKRKFALPYEVVMRIANNRFSKLARTSA
ncbi:SDR family oxidoreductase [Gordonia amarae]|uniref:SDR family oxidoreductase n=2 Tax=Gordonia amarae TaxID=36821 RepID=A0A857MGZ8_9ACTN|nr:SDR family oxidoreductase [Gordonia amarae]MCS3880063.1 NAD(P)-dependent dehydrogenase (short-subunit alcohol dehydrogenase family) [Gordonia amarae]QHN18438.1 SDR family oxidoreductase [Gordonia amarae]QHN22920.1 SDR family oxidoreductase [Gordonia amarae]QHN31823.1 SDR family oxidoreductase [Gordonia amarae]QHN40569.1 SDR family oxidoreductase [Gordonia amarae]